MVPRRPAFTGKRHALPDRTPSLQLSWYHWQKPNIEGICAPFSMKCTECKLTSWPDWGKGEADKLRFIFGLACGCITAI